MANIENICDYFAIYTSNDGMKIAEVNANNTKVSEALLNFTEKSRFVFMIRLFMPSITGLYELLFLLVSTFFIINFLSGAIPIISVKVPP